MRQYGWDAKLTDLLPALVAECPKRGSVSVHDRCKGGFREAGMIGTPPMCWGVLRAASINAEIFLPELCGPAEGSLRGPLALNKIVTRPSRSLC